MKVTKNSYNWLRLLVVAVGIVTVGCPLFEEPTVNGGESDNTPPKILSITVSIGKKILDLSEDKIYGKELIKIEVEAEDESVSSLKYDFRVIRTSDLTDVSDDLISGELDEVFNINTPDVSESTEYEIKANVTDDGGKEDSDSINIEVLPNKGGVFFIPPTLNLPASQIGATRKVIAIAREKNGDPAEIDQDSIISDKDSVADVDSVVALKEEDVNDFENDGFDVGDIKESDYGKGVKISIDINAKGIANITAALESNPDVTGEMLITVGESVLEVLEPADKTLTVGVGATKTIVVRAISEDGNLDLVNVSSDDSGVATGEVTVSDSTNKTHTITVSGISDGDTDILIEADSGKDETVAVTVSSDVSPDTPSDTITSVAVSPASAAITTGGTVALTATVNGSGSFDSTVNWTVQSGGGTLSANTGPTVSYTAPTAEGNAVVRASAAGDLNKFTDVTITISQASIVTSVSVSPASASLTAGAAVTLSATVAGTGNFATGINWAITSGGGGLSAFTGPNVTYTAPALAGTATVTATAASDPTKSASSSINVFTITGITISPTSSVIATGDNLSLTATLSGTGTLDPRINWTVSGAPGGSVAPSTSNSGESVTYTAGTTTGTATITATSAAVPGQSITAAITVANWELAGAKLNSSSGGSDFLNPIVESGSVYVLYNDQGASPNSTVRRWNETTQMWDSLGIVTMDENHERLAVDSTPTPTPYVVAVSGCCQIKVYKYTTSWNNYLNYTPGPTVTDLSIVYSNTDDRLYISYSESATFATTWVDYINPTPTAVSTGPSFTGLSPSLAISSTGTPHIAYDDGGMIGVQNYIGGNWTLIGGSGFTGSNPSLALSSVDTPYVAYRSGSNVQVRRFENAMAEQLGGNLNTTPSATSRPAIALDSSGNPYVAFQHGTSEVIVKRWNGSSWVQVGAKLNTNIMAGEYLSISFDGTTPYVAYTEGAAAGSHDAYVSRFK